MKKVMNLIEQATKIRDRRHKPGEKFDVIKAIEIEAAWRFPRLTYDVVDLDEWQGAQDEDAYVEFSPDPHLCIRRSVYDAARNGDHSCRFTLAHELAHLYLHGKTAIRRLARAPHKNFTDRTNEKEEREANIFAGALLIHYPSIKVTTEAWELNLSYVVSKEVARRAIRQKFYGKFN